MVSLGAKDVPARFDPNSLDTSTPRCAPLLSVA